MKTILRAALAAAAIFAISTTAEAHPRLIAPRPIANATVTQPREVRLTFNEPLVARFSSIAVRDRAGRLVRTGPTTLAGASRQMAVALPRLTPGQYRVAWRAVAQDTHRVTGSYAFNVASR